MPGPQPLLPNTTGGGTDSPAGVCTARRWRWPAALFIVAYLAATLFVLGLNILGDMGRHPLTYFFTWDMFPGHYTESTHRVALGRTASGRYVQLIPGPWQQFHEGVHGDLTRADMDRSGIFFEAIARQVLRLTAEEFAADPIVHVDLLEQYWAMKHNLPVDPAAEPEFPPTSHRYWRRLKEFDLPEEAKSKAAAQTKAGAVSEAGAPSKTDAEKADPQPEKTTAPSAFTGKERP